MLVLLVRYGNNNLAEVAVVYRPERHEREVLDGLQHVVWLHPGPLMLLGDFNKEAQRCTAYQHRIGAWGYTTYRTWDVPPEAVDQNPRPLLNPYSPAAVVVDNGTPIGRGCCSTTF